MTFDIFFFAFGPYFRPLLLLDFFDEDERDELRCDDLLPPLRDELRWLPLLPELFRPLLREELRLRDELDLRAAAIIL
jgi:hypothetical protein